ncbi:DNA-binding protein [Cupriavidus sp. HPC(L)]|uniref:RodZ domain-containing protein n=1 Tax=Cupriavidus sp. HPC(L) TaxID=1217418 RepID=UPI00029151A6|nr:RodZ domain-containing protein [Cupriavidus sp. HPC(L)]ESJ22346.1 DNA-binding protein [Cupriavidus sp. HPC(L)]
MNEHERAEGQAVSTNASGSANAVAQEIGASLAKARAAQGLSIHDVGARLKVPAQKVDAIESGNVDALPDLTFAKGLMRAYARLLQVDIDALLARFHAQAAPPAPEVAIRRQGSLNASFDDRRRFRSSGASASGTGGRWVWLALVAAVVCAGALFGVDHVKQWLDAREQQFTQSGSETAVESESGTVTAVLPHVMGGAASEAPGAATGTEGATGTGTGTANASATLATPLAPVTGPSATANESAPMAASRAAAPVATATPAAGELQLRFSAPTWYEVRDASGKVVLGGTAKAGDEVVGGGTAPYKVVIGNVKGVAAMTRNGEPVDLQAANRNNVARLTLP